MKKEFIYKHSDTEYLIVKLDSFDCSILWFNKGLYGLIPFAKIQNALDIWRCRNVNSNIIPTHTFAWYEIIKVSSQIANALLGEDKDNKCTYRGKDSPDTSSTDS